VGGWGSGNTTSRAQYQTVESMSCVLDIRELVRDGMVDRGDAGFVGTFDGADVDVRLEWTPWQFGGRRPWFLCPACERRCALLYWIASGDRLGWRCRVCAELRYTSTREDELARAARRVRRIRYDKLRAGDVVNLAVWVGWADPPRPPYMRRRTYDRLIAELRKAERQRDDLVRQMVATTTAGVRAARLEREKREAKV